MKNKKSNVLKLRSFLVIALVAVIGFSIMACGGGGDDDGGGGGGGGTLPPGAVTGITVESALVGTWVGDEENGTLVFSSTGVGTKDEYPSTQASVVVKGFESIYGTYSSMGGTIIASDGKVIATYIIAGQNGSYPYYSYSITGTTLTFYQDDTRSDIIFVGTKQ